MTKWEYKTCFLAYGPLEHFQPGGGDMQDSMDDKELTQLGSQGWELVTVIRVTMGLSDNREGTWGLQYIFKRPKTRLERVQ